jgi:exodeoxyribonuclease-3
MLKIYSWNVNGIRAVAKKGLWRPFIEKEQPDIILLQEIKAKPEQIAEIDPAGFSLDGYNTFWYSADKPGYSGTAILSKVQPLQVINGFPKDIIDTYKVSGDVYGDPNLEGRVIAAEFDKFWVVTKDDLSRIPLRHKHWDPAFLAYVKQLEQTKPVVFSGDLNVAHTEDDLANPKPNRGKKGFTDEERAGFQAFVDAGFVDTFRLFKQGNGYYSWWSYFANARARNVGWRIDYFLVSASLKDKVQAAGIHPKILGSDHCPVSVTLDI